jgi:hypothetical protein
MSNGGPSPLPIVVLGDSIQWGQGLRPGAPGAPSDKMAELVGAALATNSAVVTGWSGGAGIAVSVSRFAQSGATLNGPLPPPPPPPIPPPPAPAPVTSTTAFPGGEAPLLTVTPTILDQVRGAPTVIDPAAVRLVVLDGGINDVGLFASILNPFSLPPTVAIRANAACGGTLTTGAAAALLPAGATTGRMSALLAAVGPAFPNAVIVVTGYYDILSAASDLMGLIVAVGFLSGSVVPDLLVPGGWLASAIAGTTAAATAAAGVVANCAIFTATSNASLASAVTLANAAPGGTWTAEGLSVARFIFVPCPFTPINALFTGGSNGADETVATAPAFLWGFNPSLTAIGDLIDASVVAGSVVGGILGSVGGIVGIGVGSTAGALAGAAAAIAAILPLLAAVDEVAAARLGPGGACAATPPGPFGAGTVACNLASVGHPNIEGEKAYVGAITPPLITMFGTTLPAIGLAGVVAAASGCLIATAALGPSQARQLERIRRLRDECIEHSRLGRDFLAAAAAEYYAFSPIIAARMHSSFEFRERVRRLAVSPFLGFTELLTSWATGVAGGRLRELLARTLDDSLEDLAGGGITPIHVSAAADEISKLSVSGRMTPSPTAGREAWKIDLQELVSYCNAVVRGNPHGEGRYVEVLLLDPVKLYWRLLRERAGRVELATIQSRLESGLSQWLTDVSALASRSRSSVADIAADVGMLAGLLGAKQSLRQMFAASLRQSDDRAISAAPVAREERL